jgi:bacillithiol biosynthesis deacetylase BshB1
MKLDVLAFGAHPDDVEMSCGGTLAKLVSEGRKVGIIDLTRGELGSRGTAEIRDKESENAAHILGVHVRENLCFRDGFFLEDDAHLYKVIEIIRKYQPEIVLCNAIIDRHPDHGKGARLVRNAVFMSGLVKIETSYKETKQENWRPKRFFHYIQDHNLAPDFVIDISDFYEQKMASVGAHKSQFYNPNSTEPKTYISTPDFWDFFQSRAHNTGHIIGAKYGEGFMAETPLKVGDLMNLV